jgi:hypothetical protein
MVCRPHSRRHPPTPLSSANSENRPEAKVLTDIRQRPCSTAVVLCQAEVVPGLMRHVVVWRTVLPVDVDEVPKSKAVLRVQVAEPAALVEPGLTAVTQRRGMSWITPMVHMSGEPGAAPGKMHATIEHAIKQGRPVRGSLWTVGLEANRCSTDRVDLRPVPGMAAFSPPQAHVHRRVTVTLGYRKQSRLNRSPNPY